jgi:hypothetical protein
MGRKIITNSKDNWQLYSTIADDIIAEFKTEKDLKEYIALEKIYDTKIQAIKELMIFPVGWTINEKRVPLLTDEMLNKFNDWLEDLVDIDDNNEYYKNIDNKLNELLKRS